MKKPDHISQKAWDYAMELLKTAPDMWHKGGGNGGTPYCCAGTYIVKSGVPKTKDDDEYDPDCYERGVCLEGTVCHGFIGSPSMFNRAQMYFSTASSDRGHTSVDKKILTDWCGWIKNESPFAPMILNETVESMVDGGVIIDLSRSTCHLLLMMCKMLRTPYEEPERMKPWHDLYTKGVNGMLAWCYTQTHRGGSKMSGTTHCTHMMPPTKASLKLILSKDIRPPDKPKATSGSYGWNSTSVFGGSWGDNLWPAAGGKKKVKVADGWGGFIMKEVDDNKFDLVTELKKLQKEK
jgi:hypothetical protein